MALDTLMNMNVVVSQDTIAFIRFLCCNQAVQSCVFVLCFFSILFHFQTTLSGKSCNFNTAQFPHTLLIEMQYHLCVYSLICNALVRVLLHTQTRKHAQTNALAFCDSYTKWSASLNHHKCDLHVHDETHFTIPPMALLVHFACALYTAHTQTRHPNIYSTVDETADMPMEITQEPSITSSLIFVPLLFWNAIWYAQICLNYITVKYNIQPNHVRLNFHSVLLIASASSSTM